MQDSVDSLTAVGLKPELVSGGGTGSYYFESNSDVCNELQCGSYALTIADYGRSDVEYAKCSDEHSVISSPWGVLKINEKLKLVPGYCNPNFSVRDWYIGARNGKVEKLWPVSARGKVFLFSLRQPFRRDSEAG